MNELEEKWVGFVLREYEKNKLERGEGLKVLKEKDGVVGRGGGKKGYWVFLCGVGGGILVGFIVWVGICGEKEWRELGG